MSRIYTSRKKTADPAPRGKSGESISKSDMLRMSGAGAPQPMSPALREKFEPGFGADFSNIRISRGHIPEVLGVQAVAKGTDILMDSRAGMDVLGHELAHVVQQAQGQVQGGFPVVHDAALEREADVMGARAASGLSAVEGGMGDFGGEMMSIAPMSDASAPAQCKSKKDKGKEQAPAKTRGDLFREDYGAQDLAGQVEMLRNYTHVLSRDYAEDKSEEDAYFDILSKASPELMDEIMVQQGESAKALNAKKTTEAIYGGDADKAEFTSSVSAEGDHFNSFTMLLKNIVFGGNNQKAFTYYTDKLTEKNAGDPGFKSMMKQAQDTIIDGYSNDWTEANPEVANLMKEQADERHTSDVANWNASRKARLQPAEDKKKHRFRRWKNK